MYLCVFESFTLWTLFTGMYKDQIQNDEETDRARKGNMSST